MVAHPSHFPALLLPISHAGPCEDEEGEELPAYPPTTAALGCSLGQIVNPKGRDAVVACTAPS